MGASSSALQSFLRWPPRSSNHRRSPRAFPSAVNPPTSFDPPPESYETLPTACRLRLGGSFHEVSRLIAPSTSRVRRHDGFQTTAAVRPQVFATSRRFAPRNALRACFIPLARPGFPFRGFPSTGAAAAHRRRLALLPLPRAGLPLRGDPSRGPSSGPCSPAESVAYGPRLSEPSARSPPGLLPLQGLPHPDP